MTGLSTPQLESVLSGLGLNERPSPDRAGLDQLYAAWCRHVPFDNTRKLVALRTHAAGPLPGIDPSEFFEIWLTHGTGGTCWPSCNALFALVQACGFDAVRTTASMGDRGEPNHGTILVSLDDDDYLVDSSMLLNRAVCLRRDETVIDNGPLRPVEYETVDGSIRLWFEFLRTSDGVSLPCRLLTRDVSEATFRDAYEASRTASPFNDHLIAARNFADRVEAFQGRKQFTRRLDGRRDVVDHDRESLRAALTTTLGLSAAFIDEWEQSGALDASLSAEPAAPRAEPPDVLPPSRRQRSSAEDYSSSANTNR